MRKLRSKVNLFYIEAIIVLGCMSILLMMMGQLYYKTYEIKNNSQMLTEMTLTMQTMIESVSGKGTLNEAINQFETFGPTAVCDDGCGYVTTLSEGQAIHFSIRCEEAGRGQLVHLRMQALNVKKPSEARVLGSLNASYYVDTPFMWGWE